MDQDKPTDPKANDLQKRSPKQHQGHRQDQDAGRSSRTPDTEPPKEKRSDDL